MSDFPTEPGMHRNAAAQQGTGTGAGNTYSAAYATDPTPGPAPTTAGHHKHDFVSKFDPFINRATGERFNPSARADPRVGGTSPSPSPSPGATGVGTIEGGGVGGAVAAGSSTGTAGGVVPGHAHKSNLLNKLDPRVDSKTGNWKGRRGSGGSGEPVS